MELFGQMPKGYRRIEAIQDQWNALGALLDRVFTAGEQRYCAGGHLPLRRAGRRKKPLPKR